MVEMKLEDLVIKQAENGYIVEYMNLLTVKQRLFFNMESALNFVATLFKEEVVAQRENKEPVKLVPL